MVIVLLKSYSEMMLLPDFNDRYEYLRVTGAVGDPTFGSRRYLNQLLYKMPEWRKARREVIIRDNGCDLAHGDFELGDQPAYVHHINPITVEDILERRPCVFDLENLITTSFRTHQAIHYGSNDQLPQLPVTRQPNDTCPWR